MADQQILVSGTSAVPLSYTVPNAIEAALLCVNATVDGAAAAGSFLATVEIVSDGGVVVARCPCFTTLAVGGSAEISWFRMRDTQTATSTTQTPYEELILGTGGLVLYWKLDDALGSTSIADSFGTNTGNVYGAVTFQQPPLADVHAALFGAGAAGLKTDVPAVQANGLMSVEVWVKTSSVAAQNTIAWADTSSPQGRWFQVYTDAAGHVTFNFFGNDATGHGVTGTVAVNNGVRHHVVCTFFATNPLTGAGAVASIYVDGVLDTSSAIAMGGFPLADRNHALVIGSEWRNAFDDPSGINFLVGTLDEFAIYTRALTATEVAQHYAQGIAP